MRRFRPESSHSLRPKPTDHMNNFLNPAGVGVGVDANATTNSSTQQHNLELQLLTTTSSPIDEDHHSSTQLQLSIGSSSSSSYCGEKNDQLVHENLSRSCSLRETSNSDKLSSIASRVVKEQAREILRLAKAERTYAEEARQQAKRQIVLAEQEFVNAKRIRQQAQAELDKARALREHAIQQISSTILQISCYACKQKFQAAASTTSTAASQDE